MNKRIPRKPGQPAGSKKHSDLYTDENPKGTIHGLKFASKEDAEKSVNKIKNSGRSHAHKIQAAIAMEQRARVMGKTSAAAVYRKFINAMKQKTKQKNEEMMTTADAGIPQDTKNMGPKYKPVRVGVKNNKKLRRNKDGNPLPVLLKRFRLERFKNYMDAEELISEDNMSTIRNIVKRKQFGKIKLKDGQAMIDLFTASAITNAIDKRLSAKNVEKVKDMINNGTKNQLLKLVQIVMGGRRAV